jgi:ADP-ribose pyrophosphatase YjhB (NUDIX family)
MRTRFPQGKFDEIWERFNKYKRSIPVFGAILLDDTLNRVLLVRGLKAGSGWSFPRGKVNENEPGIICAGREVRELAVEFGLEGAAGWSLWKRGGEQ